MIEKTFPLHSFGKLRPPCLACTCLRHMMSTILHSAPSTPHCRCSGPTPSFLEARRSSFYKLGTLTRMFSPRLSSTCPARNQSKHRVLRLLCTFLLHTPSKLLHLVPRSRHCTCSRSRPSFLFASLSSLGRPSTLKRRLRLLPSSTCPARREYTHRVLRLICICPQRNPYIGYCHQAW